MANEFDLKSRTYWGKMGRPLFLGFISTIRALIFLLAVIYGQSKFLHI